jgi:hypothetical protein
VVAVKPSSLIRKRQTQSASKQSHHERLEILANLKIRIVNLNTREAAPSVRIWTHKAFVDPTKRRDQDLSWFNARRKHGFNQRNHDCHAQQKPWLKLEQHIKSEATNLHELQTSGKV